MTYGVEDVERATGIPKRTLQRWHDEGLLVASETTGGGGHRRYTEGDLERARVMAVLRSFGFRAPRAAKIADHLELAGIIGGRAAESRPEAIGR